MPATAASLAERLGDDVLVLEQFGPGTPRVLAGPLADHPAQLRQRDVHASDAGDVRRLGAVERDADARARRPHRRARPRRSRRPRQRRGVEACAAALAEVGFPFERLDADAVRARWPQWRIADDVVALFQADAGILDVRRACARSSRSPARAAPALHAGARYERLDDLGDEVAVHRARASCAPATSSPCTGKSTARLLAGLHDLRCGTPQRSRTSRPTRPLRPRALPGLDPLRRRPASTASPVYGERAVKVAQDLGGPEVEPDDEESAVVPARSRRVLELPGPPPPGCRRPGPYSRSMRLRPDARPRPRRGPLPGTRGSWSRRGAGTLRSSARSSA